MTKLPSQTRTLRTFYDKRTEEVRGFFDKLPTLLDADLGIDIILAYTFFSLESGQRLVLFSGARKRHRTDSSLTWQAIETHDLKRKDFQNLFKLLYGFQISKDAHDLLKQAEDTRDALMHGQNVSTRQMIQAISKVLRYCEEMNKKIFSKSDCKFKPFTGDRRGFTGSAGSFDKSTSRWVLKGMGFNIS